MRRLDGTQTGQETEQNRDGTEYRRNTGGEEVWKEHRRGKILETTQMGQKTGRNTDGAEAWNENRRSEDCTEHRRFSRPDGTDGTEKWTEDGQARRLDFRRWCRAGEMRSGVWTDHRTGQKVGRSTDGIKEDLTFNG